MEKRIILITLAVFSMVILLCQNNIEKIYAVTILTVTHGTSGNVTIYTMPAISSYVVRGTSGVNYKVINVNGAVSSVNLPTPFGSNAYGSEFDCSGTICQVYEVCVPCGAPNAYIVTFTALTGVVTGNTTIPLTGGTGTEFSALSATGSSSMYFGATCASGNTILIKSDLTRLGECAGTMNFAISTIKDVKVNGPYTAVSTSSGGTTAFSVWNGGSRVCAVALINAGDIAVTATGWLLRHGNTVSRLNNSCTVAGTLSHGLTTLTGLNINVGRGEIYVRGDGFVQVMNTTDFTKMYRLDLLDSTAPPILFHNMAVNINNAQLAVVYDDSGTGAKKATIYRLSDVATGGGGTGNNGTVGFCDIPANAFILICRNGGNGESGSAGAFIIGNVSQGTGIVGIGCSLGFVDCVSNPDVKTNGLGLLIFIASIFVVVGMFYYFSGRHAFEMPLFIWIVLIIALSAFFTITQIIDPVFLIISIVAIVALAAPKVLGVLRGNTFGGGSTE